MTPVAAANPPIPPAAPDLPPPTPAEWAVVAALTLAALALRLWRLGAVPPGLHVDEAFNILDAQAVVAGARPVFLPANAGRDVLYTYLQAPLIAALGPTATAARLASALVGAATVGAAWWAARGLAAGAVPAPRARLVALATAALVAGSYWHLHFSRFGIRAVLFPLVVCGVVAAWQRAPGGRPRAVLALALLLGLAFYAHPAGRGLVALPAAHAAYRWLRWRDGRPLRALAVAAAGMLVVAAPLLAFWSGAAWTFTSHAEEVSVLGHGGAALAANAARVLAMFNLAGDAAPWRNLPGRPVFDAWTGAAFLAGLVLALRAARRGHDGAALALAWLGALLVPTVVTDNAPNFSRAIGVLPVACLIAALGLEAVATRLAAARRSTAWLAAARLTPPPRAAAALVAASIALTALVAARDYFARWAVDPATPLAFDADKQALGAFYRRATDAGTRVYLSPALMDHPTVVVAAGERPAGFDPAFGAAMPADPAAPTMLARLPGEIPPAPAGAADAAAPDAGPATAAIPAGWRGPRFVGVGPGRIAVFDRDPAALDDDLAVAPPRGWDRLPFGPALELVGARWPARVAAGGTAEVVLAWDVRQPVGAALHTAVQLQAAGGAGLGHGDGPPLGGTYPTDRWQAGERIVSRHTLRVDAGAAAGPAVLRVGWYAPPVGDRPFEALVLDDGGTTVRVIGTLAVVR